MQTESIAMSFSTYLELFAVASLCGWSACLAIGMSFFSPGKAALIGACGIVVGFVIWSALDLPAGPWLSDFPLIPSLVGTLLVAFSVELVTEARKSPFRITGPRAEEAAARRGGVGARSAPEAALRPPDRDEQAEQAAAQSPGAH
jgi:hypothetical protein